MAAVVQHLVETRFSVGSGLTSEWLAERVDLFRRFPLPAVAAQTTNAFTWLLLCDETTAEECMEQLRDDERRVPNLTIALTSGERSPLSVLRAAVRPDTDVLITTRLDSDDAIACEYLAAIQEYAEPFHSSRHERLLVNFPRGYRLDAVNERYYRGWMPNSPFHSLFERPQRSRAASVLGGHEELDRRYSGFRHLPMLGRDEAWSHARLHQHYATHQDESIDAWLLVVHGGNRINRIPSTATVMPEGFRPPGFSLSETA